MKREEAIEFGNMWLQVNEDSKNSSTYKFFQIAIKALEQEQNTWSLNDAREDFIHDVYNTLDFLPTNEEAYRIIDSFDRVTSSIKQESILDKLRVEIESKIIKKSNLAFKIREREHNDTLLEVLDILDKHKIEVKKAMDDNVKQQLVDKLLEEPPMILSTAYVYAKNYVEYGEDITKAWTTAVQQESVLQKVRQKTWSAAFDDFKDCYKARLMIDITSVLNRLRVEIELLKHHNTDVSGYRWWNNAIDNCLHEIDAFKAESEKR